MEHRTKTEQHLGQAAESLLKISPPTEDYNHIELSEAEKNEALRLARKEKHFREERIRYQQKISQQPEYRKLTQAELEEIALHRAYELTGKDFIIDEFNAEIFNILSLYFSGSAQVEKYGFSLSKGILLLGPLGCGKTTLLRSFAINSFNAFSMVSCRKVGDDYSQAGADALNTYSSIKPVYAHQYFGQTGIGMCFDDLGTETSKKYFGNEVNVMAEIILNRYDNHQLRGKTHFTANLTTDEIEEFYGARVRSRLREMCNVISFRPDAKDKRQ